MSRDIFVQVINEKFKNYELFSLLDIIERGDNSETFIMQYVNQTVLIYNTCTDKFVSWYKISHIGRALHTNIENSKELNDFLQDLKEDIFD